MTKIGNQEPTIRFSLPYTHTEGYASVNLYELSRRKAIEWQKKLVCDILAQNEKGLWTHTRFGYSVPRQNGKGEVLLIVELYALAAGLRVLHTAHMVATAHKAWERLCTTLDDMGVEYHSIKAKGQEIVQIEGGGRVEFKTRSAKSGLGESYDILVIDEAQEYQNDQESALKYVISASPNPLTIMCGTPPTPVSSGTVFKKFKLDVLSGDTEDAGWAEWSVEDFSDVEDRDLWYATNPSLGIRLSERTLAAETGKDEETRIDFNIQRLGLWIKYNQQSAISKKEWDNTLVDELPKFTGKMDVGIKFGHGSETVSLAIAVKTTDERIFTEVIDNRMTRDGIDWIMNFIKRARRGINKIVVDGDSGQQLISDAIKAAKITGCLLPTVKEIIKANATFEQNVVNAKICRMEQPSLTNVVTNCEKRSIGSHGGFGYKSMQSTADDTLIDSVVLATWAIEEFKDPKKQKINY